MLAAAAVVGNRLLPCGLLRLLGTLRLGRALRLLGTLWLGRALRLLGALRLRRTLRRLGALRLRRALLLRGFSSALLLFAFLGE